jgi:hypothetical protein
MAAVITKHENSRTGSFYSLDLSSVVPAKIRVSTYGEDKYKWGIAGFSKVVATFQLPLGVEFTHEWQVRFGKSFHKDDLRYLDPLLVPKVTELLGSVSEPQSIFDFDGVITLESSLAWMWEYSDGADIYSTCYHVFQTPTPFRVRLGEKMTFRKHPLHKDIDPQLFKVARSVVRKHPEIFEHR